jgi:hypothetical protein
MIEPPSENMIKIQWHIQPHLIAQSTDYSMQSNQNWTVGILIAPLPNAPTVQCISPPMTRFAYSLHNTHPLHKT